MILTSRSVIPMRIILSPHAPQIPTSCLLCFYMTHHTTHAIANVHSPAPSISFFPMPFSRSNLSMPLDSTCTPSIFPMHIIRIFCSPSPVWCPYLYDSPLHNFHTTFSITTPTQNISLQIFILTRPPFHFFQCLTFQTISPRAHALSSNAYYAYAMLSPRNA